MPRSQVENKISITEFRQILISSQLLGNAARHGIAEVVEQAGPIRTLGGVDVYLALRARAPGLKREQLDRAVEQRDVQVIPAARSCIYLVAKRDVPCALRFAGQLRASRDEREFLKAGIHSGELEKLGKIIVQSLQKEGRLSTTQLRKQLPEGCFRSLGDAGKKLGLSSTLPPALRLLEFEGRIERFLKGQRLDSEVYLWGPTNPDAVSPPINNSAPAGLNRRMAEIYFRAAGLGTQKMFAGWSGLNQRDSKAAIEKLDLQTFHLEGEDEPFLGFEGIEPASASRVSFLPFEDNLIALQAGPQRLVDLRYHDVPVPVWGRTRQATLGQARHSTLRSIVAANQIAGFWEFDPKKRQVETFCFADLTPRHQHEVKHTAEGLGNFINEELEHGRSFSIDTDRALAERVQFIRSLQ